MSDMAEDVKLSLKVMINKEKNKVLFAEADTDFANVLLSFLTFPLGRIAKLLEKHYADKSLVFGSITSLYKSLADLDDSHFSTPAAKLMPLDPRGYSDSICRNLKVDISESTGKKYFYCENLWINCFERNWRSLCMYYGGTARCDCGKYLDTEAFNERDSKDTGVFTINKASFIISDDLRMVPYSIGFFRTLSNMGVTDAEGAELRNVTLGTNEIMHLLKCSLLSNTPLTDFILNKRETVSLPSEPEPGYILHKIEKEETSNCKNIVLKVMVQKSTNKVLFAQAEDDFIELLCSFLIIPIGGVEFLLDNNTCLKNLDNLYSSVSDVSLDKYFITPYTKMRLMNPKIPHFYMSKNTFLPLVEESATKVYFSGYEVRVPSIKSPKGDGNYVIGPTTTFMVTDDLTVTPFCMSASFSILNQLNIPLSDVDELEVPIGLQEGLSILKASLTSTSALTNGLINHITRKQPKQEH